jgi:hypothetical protein
MLNPLTPSQQYQILRAVGIPDGAIFDIDIIGEGWTLENRHGVIAVVRGPLDPRNTVIGLTAIWMLAAYANLHGLTGFNPIFTNGELKQVATWVKGLPDDMCPYDMQKACQKFWANFKRPEPIRGDA